MNNLNNINKVEFYENLADVIADADSVTLMLRSTKLIVSVKGSTQILINDLAETLYSTFEENIMGILSGVGMLTIVSHDYTYLKYIHELIENAVIYYGISR